ncbi:helix-turn-helix domain-containing protein [Paludisphaera rhizosphaerae]|uniref:helix-turn-helix domain-containing protein n=1 Tax=Paludisphaera rhizosphaerae TaxID=2711216 RepID=UPI0013EBB7B9|nr:helix-turn-helix domain-containing protein [Paludisphaera rhizosphaerae]
MNQAAKWTPERIENARLSLLVRMTNQGLTYRAIGQVLGISPSTVCRTLQAMPPAKRIELESLDWRV